MKKWLFVVLFIISIQVVYGHDIKDSSKVKNNNIIDLSEKLNLHFYGKQKMTSFAFEDKNTGQSIRYKPNSQFNIGFGLNYKLIGIGLAFNFKLINNDDTKYGNTKRIDLQINAYGDKSVIDFTFFGYKSFYIQNPEKSFPNYALADPYYIRPDIRAFSIGLSYIYIFNNKKFSYKAAFKSTAIQKKNAGSFFTGTHAIIYGADADSSFFPVNSYFSEFPNIKALNRIAVGIISGYAYNFIIKRNYYVSTSLSIAQNISKQAYSIENTFYQQKWIPGFDVLPRFAVGYNSQKWYSGFSIVARITELNTIQHYEGLLFNYQYGNFRFFVGRRFDVKTKK